MSTHPPEFEPPKFLTRVKRRVVDAVTPEPTTVPTPKIAAFTRYNPNAPEPRIDGVVRRTFTAEEADAVQGAKLADAQLAGQKVEAAIAAQKLAATAAWAEARPAAIAAYEKQQREALAARRAGLDLGTVA